MSKILMGLLVIHSLGCSSTRFPVENGLGEVVSPDESALHKEIADLSVAVLKKNAAANKGLMPRDVHSKHHGCVRAKFVVNDDKALPPEYRAGVFAEPGKEYAAWIRFSNGSPKVQEDKKGDARGMAVKLMGVDGAKLLETGKAAGTQDFLMITHDAFFIKDGKDYVEFFKRLEKGSSPAWFFFGRLPWRWAEFQAARKTVKNGKEVVNPLSPPYFSATPYLLGENTVVNYSAQPCGDPRPNARNNFPDSADFLRLNMERTLAPGKGKKACFRFMAQRRVDPRTMSVEDSRIPWDQTKSPFVPIATITIPPQEFSSERQMRFCENLSFTPWHSLPAHRPLGNINRARKQAYEAISRFRHEANHEEKREPSTDDNP